MDVLRVYAYNSKGFGEHGKMVFISGGQGKRLNCKRNWETKRICVNWEYNITSLRLWGMWEQANIFQGNERKGTTPLPQEPR